MLRCIKNGLFRNYKICMLRLFASNLFSFQKPSFHASFAWSLGDVSENISPSTLAKIQVENSNNFPKLQKRIMSNPTLLSLCRCGFLYGSRSFISGQLRFRSGKNAPSSGLDAVRLRFGRV